MKQSRSAFTLVELLVVVSIIGLLVAILLPSLQKAQEQTRSVKCLANLHAQMIAVISYTADYDGTLPGPVHPAIKRKLFTFGNSLNTDESVGTGAANAPANAAADRQKSLTWVLRPYYGNRSSDPERQNKTADAVSSCPTAERIVPDSEFFDIAKTQTGCWRERPYSYVINSAGPTSRVTTIDTGMWSHSDPPHYFGAWYYCDSTPSLQTANGVSWKPKKIDRIKFAAGEWAIGDAWFRRVGADGQGASRPGAKVVKPWQGTIGLDSGANSTRAPIPDRPYHGVKYSTVSTHYRLGTGTLPPILTFKGRTNLGYFDGHAAAVTGGWVYTNDIGGTVNPYWQQFGGKHLPPFVTPD